MMMVGHACNKGYENIVEYLVEHGANINKENNNDDTPILIACEIYQFNK